MFHSLTLEKNETFADILSVVKRFMLYFERKMYCRECS
jgi:hypothetical protein